ncbi:tail completion protein gp17 [Wielerella bovis]|uniref:tail completion protein gp17 n=1 Tax=Wielerella bovis TaxID=2917790 RepID=UPI0020189BE9|nr:DUF3168 domain-containing protein [Wielerella bovis]ULJ67904.1 DUF3168 domain-containing protein [Wielerella bovis]
MIEKVIIQKIKEINAEFPVFHDFAPPQAKPPLAIISRVGGAGKLFLDQETAGGYEVRVQITVWAENRVTAILISNQIESLLCRLPELTSDGAAVSTHDPETDWRGMRQDFLCVEQS